MVKFKTIALFGGTDTTATIRMETQEDFDKAMNVAMGYKEASLNGVELLYNGMPIMAVIALFIVFRKRRNKQKFQNIPNHVFIMRLNLHCCQGYQRYCFWCKNFDKDNHSYWRITGFADPGFSRS